MEQLRDELQQSHLRIRELESKLGGQASNPQLPNWPFGWDDSLD